MSRDGYVTFDGIDCVYSFGHNEIKLIPINKEDLRKLNTHFDDQHFMLSFEDDVDKNCIAFVDRVSMNLGHSLSLIPKYLLKLLNDCPISSMQIVGASVDEVFHPAGYYFIKHELGKRNTLDLTREIEKADEWTITVDCIEVDICLQYGGILHRGISSDMMLHPQLVAYFQPTTDWSFLVKTYSVITRFLQLAQYNSNYGESSVYLRGDSPTEHNSGYLFDWTGVGSKRSFFSEVEYRYIKPYIENLLQFSADNADISLAFLPNADFRWNRTDYSPQTLTALFAAFESEYKANRCAYEIEATEDLSAIKKAVIEKVRECSSQPLSEVERTFLLQAENRIFNLGNQIGQTRKVNNTISTLRQALNSSAEQLFIRGRIGSSDGFSEKEIEQISKALVKLRAQVSHEYSLSEFDDLQAEYIHFLEILVYAQMLRRAGIDDAGIELLIGIVFHCNYTYMHETLKAQNGDNN